MNRTRPVRRPAQLLTVVLVIGTLVACAPTPQPAASGAPSGSVAPASPSNPASGPSAAPSEPSGPALIAGVRLYSTEASHVNGAVTYEQTPPVGGAHSPTWLNCGVYTEQVPNANAVHDLEHGAVWVTYDPTLGAEQVSQLRAVLPPTHTLMSPYPGMDSPIVISAWNAQLKVENASDPRLSQFIAQYRNSPAAPEPGAPCTGGLEAPGRLLKSNA